MSESVQHRIKTAYVKSRVLYLRLQSMKTKEHVDIKASDLQETMGWNKINDHRLQNTVKAIGGQIVLVVDESLHEQSRERLVSILEYRNKNKHRPGRKKGRG